LKRDQDVVYFVEIGRAVLVAAHQRIPLQPGSIVRIRAGVEHQFEEMEAPPRVLAFVARQ
jgi:mannose-6-phosphate isomerase-like protein (cupin superfamily)